MAGESDKCLGGFQTRRMWIGRQVEETRIAHCICTDNLGDVFLFSVFLSLFIVLCGVMCYTGGLFTTQGVSTFIHYVCSNTP